MPIINVMLDAVKQKASKEDSGIEGRLKKTSVDIVKEMFVRGFMST